MTSKVKYYLVKSTVMPQILLKVVQTKQLMENGKASTVNEAVLQTGISRSAYYKYKDSVQPFYEAAKEKIITFYAVLRDEPGVLSSLLNSFAKTGVNILTINQNIPINGIANITITGQTGNMKTKLEVFLDKLRGQSGIISIEIMARE